MTAVSQEDIDALEELKASHGIIKTSLENDLLLLRKQHQDLTIDHEEQKTHLLKALLSRDNALQDLASLKERTGTSEDEKLERAKARTAKEAELQQVSAAAAVAAFLPPTPSAKKTNIFNRVSRIFGAPKKGPVAPTSTSRPSTARPPTARPTFSRPATARQRNQWMRRGPDHAVAESQADGQQELALELAALGTGSPIPPPEISPRFIQLPPSPIVTHAHHFHFLRRHDRKTST